VLAGGAINSPALLLRSALPDPTAIWAGAPSCTTVVLSAARLDERIEGWAGAPQTVYSDHFLDTQAIDGPIGFKLEVPPMHPVHHVHHHGRATARRCRADLAQFAAHARCCWRCCATASTPTAPAAGCGSASDGSPVLDYPITAAVRTASAAPAGDGRDPVRRRRARRHAAARAGPALPSWAEAQAGIAQLPCSPT
jgi:hypothetical protein